MSQDFISVRGRSLIIVQDHDGLHCLGELNALPRETVRRLDVWLDSRDAANEGPDGRLPT